MSTHCWHKRESLIQRNSCVDALLSDRKHLWNTVPRVDSSELDVESSVPSGWIDNELGRIEKSKSIEWRNQRPPKVGYWMNRQHAEFVCCSEFQFERTERTVLCWKNNNHWLPVSIETGKREPIWSSYKHCENAWNNCSSVSVSHSGSEQERSWYFSESAVIIRCGSINQYSSRCSTFRKHCWTRETTSFTWKSEVILNCSFSRSSLTRWITKSTSIAGLNWEVFVGLNALSGCWRMTSLSKLMWFRTMSVMNRKLYRFLYLFR